MTPTPLDIILKAAHMELEAESTLVNAVRFDGTHQVVIRIKPRGDAIRASVAVETTERNV